MDILLIVFYRKGVRITTALEIRVASSVGVEAGIAWWPLVHQDARLWVHAVWIMRKATFSEINLDFCSV